MKRHKSVAIKLSFCLLALAPAATPGAAPVLTANPSSVNFQYGTEAPPPQPVFVTVTASDLTTPTLSVSITAGAGTPSTLFPLPSINGNVIQVGIDLNTLSTLATGEYTATVTVTATGFAPLDIPVTLGVNTQLTIVASPTSLTFTPPTGPTVQTVSLTGPAVSFDVTAATSTGGPWLSVSSDSTFTPATLTVTVNPGTLASGSYGGAVTVTPTTGSTLTIPVTMQVGANTLTATPTSFAFAYTVNGTIPLPQVLQLSSTIANNTFVAQASSSGNWLLINGATSNVSGSLPADVNVTVSPAGLTSGTYQGTITITDGHSNTQTVTATVVVNSVGTYVNPPTMSFVAQTGGAAPASQVLSLTALANTSFTASTTQPWLTISPTSGPTPSKITVNANPAGLAPGTYKANVQISETQRVQTVPVTFTVSANPVLLTDIGSITYSYIGGNPPPLEQTINVNVSSGSPEEFTFASGLPSWLQVTTKSMTTPAALTVNLLPQGLPNGTYLASILITPTAQGGLTVTIPVLLTVAGAIPIVANPTSLSFTAPAGGSPRSLTVGVTASSPTNFTASVSTATGAGWLTVSPLSGTATVAKTTLTVTADATGLSKGTYLGTLTLTSAIGVITKVPVTFTVGSSSVPFTVSPTSLTFVYAQNESIPAAQTLTITGSQDFTAGASVTSGGNWLSVAPTSGTGNATLSVSVNPAGMAIGTFTGTITVTPSGGTAQAVPVTLTVSSATIVATPNTLTFAYTINGTVPAGQNVSLTTTSGAITYTATSSATWLTVTPASGTAPTTLTVAVDPTGLEANTYNGSIMVSGVSETPISIAVTLTVSRQPPPQIDRVVNSASYVGGGISPGEIIVVFGSGLGPAAGVLATVDSRGFIEPNLAGIQVTFNGYGAPILFANATQINAIVPYELAGLSSASVTVSIGDARSNSLTLPLVSSVPGIYAVDQSGTGPGAILDLSYNLVSATNPVAAGDIIQIFATGQGQTSPGGVDGMIEPLSLPLPALTLAPAMLIGNLPATIQYIGAAPGLVAGALQINAYIPAGLPSGPASVVVSVGANSSQNGITVAIK